MTNEEATEELIEQDFPNIIDDFKYQLAKDKIVKDNDIKAEVTDVQELATQVAQAQFAQYGMSNLPVEMLQDYVKRMLEKEETVKGLFGKVVENKIAAWLKENITIDEKEITSEEFSKLTALENGEAEDIEEDIEEAVIEEAVIEEETESGEEEVESKD